MIGNGKHIEAFHMVQAFNLEETYPLPSILKGLIEKLKQTAVQIFRKNKKCKSLTCGKPKELKDLWIARNLAEKELVDSSQRSAIMAEIKYLLGIYAKKHKQSNKKRKKEQERLKGPHSPQLQEPNKNKLIQGKQHQLHQQENKAQVTQQQATLKLPTPAIPLVPNVAQIQNFGCPPYAAMHGIHSYPAVPAQPGWPGINSYSAQPVWPGGQGRPLAAPQLGAPQYMGRPLNPFPNHPPFCPR